MSSHLSKATVALVCLAPLLVAGCANNKDREAATADSISRAQATADRALNTANEALNSANTARAEADKAEQAAAQTQNMAQAANDKADRMYQRSLRK